MFFCLFVRSKIYVRIFGKFWHYVDCGPKESIKFLVLQDIFSIPVCHTCRHTAAAVRPLYTSVAVLVQ